MESMKDGLFELDDSAPDVKEHRSPMTEQQRAIIRDLFAMLGVADARSQFETVAELTGVVIRSVSELEMTTANILIGQLKGRVASALSARTGDAWADRDEDTWIDRL